MDLTLTRIYAGSDGVLSVLYDGDNNEVCLTLEHAYLNEEKGWLPKILDGEYVCKRGYHRLNGMISDFETFEVTGVTGHTGLLFHCGNLEKDSEGCILTGEDTKSVPNIMVTNSRVAFAKFMASQTGFHDFKLTVVHT